MSLRFRLMRWLVCLCPLFAFGAAQNANDSSFPHPEKLSYRIEWRLVQAGTATIEMAHTTPDDWETKLNLESIGVVGRLYKVLDSYHVVTDDKFCASNSFFDAQEGKRHTLTRLIFKNAQHEVQYEERNVLKNSTTNKQLQVPPCTHEIAGGLAALRQSNLQPGKWASLPLTDGKKMAFVKIEGLDREPLTIDAKTYQTIRYEAFVFDNVLYKRKGRLLIWITDDSERLPVQIRLQVGFPIGNVTVQLEKDVKK